MDGLSYQANILGITDWVDQISKIGRERQKVFCNMHYIW